MDFILKAASPIPDLTGIASSHHVFKDDAGNVFYRPLACHCLSPSPCYCHKAVVWPLRTDGHRSLPKKRGRTTRSAVTGSTSGLLPSYCPEESNVDPEAPLLIRDGDFVVVRLQKPTEGCEDQHHLHDVFNVACVQKCLETGVFWVQFMRRQESTITNIFVFPPEDDYGIFAMRDIAIRLCPPKLVGHNQHHFTADELLQFGVCLR